MRRVYIFAYYCRCIDSLLTLVTTKERDFEILDSYRLFTSKLEQTHKPQSLYMKRSQQTLPSEMSKVLRSAGNKIKDL